MMIGAIRFDKENYISVSITDDGIELFTIDGEGNKKEYTVTEKNTRKSKKESE